MKTYCYHLRNTKGVKLVGGTIHAENLEDAAEGATHSLTATISPSGRNIWLHKEKGEVSVYLSVLPEYTLKGVEQLAQVKKFRDEQSRAENLRSTEIQTKLEDKIQELGGTEEVLKLLSQK